jgi:hypothetical protein
LVLLPFNTHTDSKDKYHIMGTRGVIGFVVDGQEKLTYNHFDSYPSGVGYEVLNWLRTLSGSKLDEVWDKAKALTLVNADDKPTPGQIEALKTYADQGVSTNQLDDWYVLLRQAQGSLGAFLDAGYAPDSHEFPLDSLFCEWAYVIDFDQIVFEVYKGFQKVQPTEGRWKDAERLPNHRGDGPSDYWPVQRVGVWSLERLPDDAEFLALDAPSDLD